MKPGLQRAIPATILAFFLAAAFVSLIQRLQMGDAYVYNSSVTLVLAPFVMVFAFIWGMGGLDPRMSEHAHGPQETDGVAIVPAAETHDDHHHNPYEEAEKNNPLRILTGQIWTVATVVLLVFFGVLAFAQLPTGLRLDTTDNPMGSASLNATNAKFDLPVGLGTFEADKLSVFLGFVAFTMVSLLAVAGLLGLTFYMLNQQVVTVRTVPNTSIDDPENSSTLAGRALHAPLKAGRGGVALLGRGAGALARGLKRGLPAFFGQK